jgi:L-threonylcarbamoyladenylate synthase
MTKTLVLPADDAQALQRAVSILREGGLVCFPTDTVYGVAAHAYLPQAVERLYIVKERGLDKAIPLLLGEVADVERVARAVPPLASRLMERFWPGGLTIVLWAQAHVPAIVTAGTGSVAVRLPDHATPRALANALGAPLAATSANLSGQPSPRSAADVKAYLDGRVDLILDGGPCPGGVDSTVVDVTKQPPVIARVGAIAAEMLQRLWNPDKTL